MFIVWLYVEYVIHSCRRSQLLAVGRRCTLRAVRTSSSNVQNAAKEQPSKRMGEKLVRGKTSSPDPPCLRGWKLRKNIVDFTTLLLPQIPNARESFPIRASHLARTVSTLRSKTISMNPWPTYESGSSTSFGEWTRLRFKHRTKHVVKTTPQPSPNWCPARPRKAEAGVSFLTQNGTHLTFSFTSKAKSLKLLECLK